jgi:hypothetical protein
LSVYVKVLSFAKLDAKAERGSERARCGGAICRG